MYQDIKVVALDADDTLWVNEPLFHEAQYRFGEIVSEWIAVEDVMDEHYRTEVQNIPAFGYGIKGFTLSLIETALRVSDRKVSAEQIVQIIQIGRDLIHHPVELIDGVQETLDSLSESYRLILATKGDLLDQERKLERSGLSSYFHHVEVMSDKSESSYRKLLKHLDIAVEQFLMIGNSVRSDIDPVLRVGGYAIHVPFEVEWMHERVEDFDESHSNFRRVQKLSEVCEFLDC